MQETTFLSGGEPLYGVLHRAKGEPAGTLVFVHGFLSNHLEFMGAPDRLAEMGWNVLAFDQRGWGRSGGKRERVSTERGAEDVRSAVAFLREEGLAERVGLVGHSMGTIFTSAASRTLPGVRALAQVAPMRTIRDELSPLEFQAYKAAHAASLVKERLGLGPLRVPYKLTYEDLFVDPQAAARARELDYLERSVSLANYDALMSMDGERLARQVTAPVLVAIAERDKAVRPANSRAVYEAYPGPKELVELACGHSAFGDCDQKRLLDAIDGFMRKHLGA